MNKELLNNRVSVVKHPATWLFACCWISAMAYMFSVFGLCEAVTVWSGRFAGVLLFCWFTVLITETPATIDNIKDRQGKLWATVVLIGFVVLRISNWLPWWTFPGINEFLHLAGRTAEWIGLPYNYGRNPTAYCLVPLLFLVPITGFRYLGFERGHRTFCVVALWCVIPLLAVVAAFVSGSLTIGKYLQSIVSNTMQNGPWEEFLWRGALQTRLVVLLGVPWGIVLTSLLFGVWHFNAQMQFSDGNFMVAVARTIIMQSTFGLAMGIIYWRTRNLVTCSVCHVVFNSVMGSVVL